MNILEKEAPFIDTTNEADINMNNNIFAHGEEAPYEITSSNGLSYYTENGSAYQVPTQFGADYSRKIRVVSADKEYIYTIPLKADDKREEIHPANDEQPAPFCSSFAVESFNTNLKNEEAGVTVVFKGKGSTREKHINLQLADIQTPHRNDGVLSILSSNGFYLPPNNTKAFISLLVEAVRNCNTYKKITARMGWLSDTEFTAYVLPNETFDSVPGRNLIFENPNATKNKNIFTPKGTLDEYKNNVLSFIEGNPVPMFAVLVALTPPLIRPFNYEGGGVLFKGNSSEGKTGVLVTAASVWSIGNEGSCNTIDEAGTKAGFYEAAKCCNDNAFFIDEIKQDEKGQFKIDLANAIYSLANKNTSNKKIRDKTTGQYINGEDNDYTVVSITASEKTLFEILNKKACDELPAGVEVRLTTIPLSENGKAAFTHNLHGYEKHSPDIKENQHQYYTAVKEKVKNYYGVLGRAFAEHLALNVLNTPDTFTTFKAELSELTENFIKLCQKNTTHAFDTQVIRIIRNRFALAYATGVMAHKIGLIPWSVEDMENACLYCFNNWLFLYRGTTANLEDIKPLRTLKNFIDNDIENRFPFRDGTKQTSSIKTAETQSTPYRTDGYRVTNTNITKIWLQREEFTKYIPPANPITNPDETYFLIQAEKLKSLYPGANLKQVKKILVKAGWLLSEKSFRENSTLTGSKCAFYVFSDTAIHSTPLDNADEEEEKEKPLMTTAIFDKVAPKVEKGEITPADLLWQYSIPEDKLNLLKDCRSYYEGSLHKETAITTDDVPF